MTHRIGYGVTLVAPQEHYFRCSCGATVMHLLTRQMAEDEADKHLRLVDRVRTTLGSRNGTLSGAHRHFVQMAASTEGPEQEQWQALADEVGHRLGIGLPEEKQEDLFTL